MKSCIYCKTEVHKDSVVDVCTRCGVGVWGPKMFKAILENMDSARKAGDLYQGSVTESQNTAPRKSGLSSIAQEALETQETAPAERQLEDDKSLKPTNEDIPPLVESFPETAQSQPESLGPEAEITPQQPAQEMEAAAIIVDNVNQRF